MTVIRFVVGTCMLALQQVLNDLPVPKPLSITVKKLSQKIAEGPPLLCLKALIDLLKL